MKLLILAIVALLLFLMNPNREGLCDSGPSLAEQEESCKRTGAIWDPVAKTCGCKSP